MAIETRQIEDAIILDLCGRFDAAAKKEVQQAIDAAFATGTSHVILNLTDVSLVDSAAIGLLAINHQKVKQKGGRISLLNPKPEVRMILDMAAMPRLIPSFELRVSGPTGYRCSLCHRHISRHSQSDGCLTCGQRSHRAFSH